MANIDPMDVFTPLQRLLTFNGLWPVEKSSVTYTIKGYVVSLIPTSILLVLITLRAYADTGSLLAFGLSSAIATTWTYHNHKMATMLRRKKEFLKFFTELRNTASFNFPNSAEKYLAPAVYFSKALIKIITYFSMCFLIITCTYPLYQFDPEQPLPLPVVFDLRDRPLFITVLYIFQVVVMIPATFNYIYADLMMYGCIILARAYFKILKEALTEAINGGSANNLSNVAHDMPPNDSYINEKLGYCVKYHNAILKYVSAVERAFSTIFLGQILSNLYLICIIGFCVVTVNEINGITLFLFSYLVLITAQFAISCAAANEIIIESSEVGQACYIAKWTECGAEVRKTMFIIMERSKRPVMLTAAKFVPLSLMTLMAVLKSSLSYFTVLNAVFGKRESD